MTNKYSDIIVIGGGPAGSTISTMMARRGMSVRLFEKEKFPRPHVGESLLPFCYHIFEELGVLEDMEKRFIRKPGACFVNQDGQEEMTYCFNKVMDQKTSLSFHVRRDEFDQMLLNNSAANGVEVHEEYRVTKVEFEDKTCRVNLKNAAGEMEEYTSRFVVDATGRDCFISRSHKTLKPIEGLDRVAVSGHWSCNEIPEELRSGSVRITYLEGDDRKGWIWCIPIDSDRVSIGVVVDGEYFKNRANDLRSKSSDWQLQYYLEELKTSSSMASIIKDMEFVGPINVNGNYSYKSDVKYGDNYALVGDASQFIDPIFASGVYIAMKSAMLLADPICEIVKNDDNSDLLKAYKYLDDGYKVVHELINIYYDPSSMNFAKNDLSKIDGEDDSFSGHNQSFALIHLLLAGDFFEKGDVYLPFLQSLRDKKKLEKWQNLIHWDHHLTKEMDHDSNCGEMFEKIFQLELEA